jgi:DNA polymerase sigma
VYTIRSWAKAIGISGGDNGQLTSYALTLMVIHFLQTIEPPVIPSLQNISRWLMYANETSDCEDDQWKDVQKCYIDGWECSFFEDVSTLSPSLNSKPVGKGSVFYFKHNPVKLLSIELLIHMKRKSLDYLNAPCW